MSVYGYIRVSTDKQDKTNQTHEILEYANKEKMGNVDFIEETISSRVKFEKRDISNLITMMNNGDTLLVTELSRIGRSTMEVMSVFKTLVEKGVKTHIIKSNFKIGADEDKITSSVLIFAFGLAAELERDLISQRTKAALAVYIAARKINVKLTQVEITDVVGLNRATLSVALSQFRKRIKK